MKDTKIQWCDHTFSPWIGCTKVSPGYNNCYAEAYGKRFHCREHCGKTNPRRRTSAANWKQPLVWDKAASRLFLPHDTPRVFCGSLCDWLDDEVPIAWLADLLALITETPNLDWLLLTKRPENFQSRLEHVYDGWIAGARHRSLLSRWLERREPPNNIWIGATVENQEQSDSRTTELLKIPSKVRFLSCEPLLEAVDLELELPDNGAPLGIDWVICGSESGAKRRRMKSEWAISLRAQCAAAGMVVDGKEHNEFPHAQ